MKRPNYLPFYCDKCATKYPPENGCYHNSRQGMRFCIPCFHNLQSINTNLDEDWTFSDGMIEVPDAPISCVCDKCLSELE